MYRLPRLFAAMLLVWAILPARGGPVSAVAAESKHSRHAHYEAPQETGFLNRRLELHGISYRFQVYLPEEFRREDHKQWPIVLFLHGRGERGSEGLWQTQIGLPQELRDHPERWPFIVVLPQCPLSEYWTDPEMQAMAMAALEQEAEEFHADPERTYLSGLSLGGYGAWELAKAYPHRWAAVAIAASGIFWSYAPERWQQASTLPAEYARAIGRTPVWLFHGAEDPVVPPRESELMYEALKAAGGHVKLWVYQGYKHDCWTRAYNEPELPRWLLAHRAPPLPAAPTTGPKPQTQAPVAEPGPFAERLVIPFHPPAMKLSPALLESLAGDYRDLRGHPAVSIYRQGEMLFEKNQQGEVAELAPETPAVFFYLNGSATTRLIFERDAQGRVIALTLRDDRHEERWEKHVQSSSR
jgi:predicted esterase